MIAAAKEIYIDVAAAAVLSEVDGIFTLKAKQRGLLETFLGEHSLHSTPDLLWQELC